MQEKLPVRIAIVGAGPAGMIMYKKVVHSGASNFEIDLFERKATIGSGMPYSTDGAGREHVTNISDNEMKNIVTSVGEWIQNLPEKTLREYEIDPDHFRNDKVLPRLLFGRYLKDQFQLLLQTGREAGITTRLHLNCPVIDIQDFPEDNQIGIRVEEKEIERFDLVIICSGHNWPAEHEDSRRGYYSSPYPPSKLNARFNHPVALRGSSLTAIDAIKTLARANGHFRREEDGKVVFVPSKESPEFALKVHSRNGLLPAIRFHLEDPLVSDTKMLSKQQIWEHLETNDGFLSLDFMFEKNFKDNLRLRDPEFYERIKEMNMEAFVEAMMALRERVETIQLFRAEFTEAKKSLRRQESVHWKEMLVILSYAMNYPAKYLSAEDMIRYQYTLAPLISIVIASVPQASCLELLALDDVGLLEIIEVGNNSVVDPRQNGGVVYTYNDTSGKELRLEYETFVDCIGQRQLSWEQLPFPSLVKERVVAQAYIRFQSKEEGRRHIQAGNEQVQLYPSGEYYLKVPGLAINDYFQVLDQFGVPNPRIFIMAVPYIGGYNPDYSGLDFCEEASESIIYKITERNREHIVA